ncbi:MAG: hypothetical protein MUP27_12740, partial [Desulfobacterales bacterium]|nr:hypothetical protein [Desulfobacterales bacterium]
LVQGLGGDASCGEREAIVVGARIESRLWIPDIRASIFKLLASIRASSPLNNILLDPKPNGLRNPNLKNIS